MRDSLSPYTFPYARYPAVRLLICFSTGMLLCRLSRPGIGGAGAVLLALLAFYLVADIIYRKRFIPFWNVLSLISYLLLITCLGYFRAALHQRHAVTLPSEELYALQDTLQFTGNVESVNPGRFGIRYRVAVDSVVAGNGFRFTGSFPVLLEQPKVDSMNFLPLGSRIIFAGEMVPIPGRRNPHDFDYRKYLKQRGIGAEVKLTGIRSVRQQHKWFGWVIWRSRFDRAIDRVFSPGNRAVARALLIGQKNYLTDQVRQSFSHAGLAHLMAVSGLHVGFLISPFWLLIPWLRGSRFGRLSAIFILSLILLIYAGLTGFPASVLRASLMALFFAYGRIFRKIREPLNVLGCAALIILLINPGRLYDISFQLSFAAVATILLTFPAAKRAAGLLSRRRWIRRPAEGIMVSILVQFGLFPLLGWYFHQYSLISPVSNIIAIPLAQVIVMGGMAAVVLTMFWPALGSISGIPADITTGWLNGWAYRMSHLPGSWISVPHLSVFIFVLWFSAIGCLATWGIARLRWKWIGFFICMTALFPLSNLFYSQKEPHLFVTFFDVGQGDGLMISTPDHRHILIDTGRWMWHTDSGKRVILPELKARNIHRLDAVLLTHPQADHIGGIVSLIQTIPVDTIFNIGRPYDSQLYKRYHKLAEKKRIPLRRLYAGRRLFVGSGIRMYVLAPERDDHNPNVNDLSLIIKLVYGHTSFLFTGDAEKPEELEVDRDFGRFLNSDVLKVAHHGSSTSSSALFLQLVTPKIAVVSVGRHNHYGHPGFPAVQRLIHSRALMHYTALEGAVTLVSDGRSIWQKK